MPVSYSAVLRAELGPLFLADYGSADYLKAELRSVIGRIDTGVSGLVKEKVLRYDCYVLVDASAPCTLIVLLLSEGVNRDQASHALQQVQAAVRQRDDLNLMAVSGDDRPLQRQLQPIISHVVDDMNAGSSGGDVEAGGSSSDGRLSQLRNEVNSVKQVMASNVERVLARGERLDDLTDRTESLQAASQQFSTSAYRVRRATCWRSAKWNIILLTVVATLLLIVAVLILYYCGVFN